MPMIHLGSADCQCIMPPCPCDDPAELQRKQEENMRRQELVRLRQEQILASFVPETIRSDSMGMQYVSRITDSVLGPGDCGEDGIPVIVAYPDGSKKYGCYKPPQTIQSGTGKFQVDPPVSRPGLLPLLLIAGVLFLVFSGGGKEGN